MKRILEMFRIMRMRRDYYIDPRLQFKYVSISLFFTFINIGIFILWMVGMNVVSNFVVGDLELQLVKLGGTILVLLIIIFFGTFSGVKVSHHIAGPIYKFSQKTKEIKKGVITSEIFLRTNDEFVGFQSDFNEMMEGLEKIIKKDRTKIKEIEQKLDNLSGKMSDACCKELRNQLLEIKQELQSVTKSFVLSEDVVRE